MKKKNLKLLKLNKKSISNFKVKGGLPPTSYNCLPVEEEEGPLGWLTLDNRHICNRW